MSTKFIEFEFREYRPNESHTFLWGLSASLPLVSIFFFSDLPEIVYGRSAHNNINSQLDAKITNFIHSYNQLIMFRGILSPILRNTRLCLQLVV